MLSPTQQTTLRALMDRIIPPDDDPGAWDAGVGDYLAAQFERDLRDYEDAYRAGLDALDAEALAGAHAGFAILPAAEQDALLRRVEVGAVVHTWPIDPVTFFQSVVQHVAEGYYSNPANGGNRDERAWHMIGFLPGVPAGPKG
jgi:hypothetical protein